MLRFGKTNKKKKNLQSLANFTGKFSALSTTSVLKGKNCSIFGSQQSKLARPDSFRPVKGKKKPFFGSRQESCLETVPQERCHGCNTTRCVWAWRYLVMMGLPIISICFPVKLLISMNNVKVFRCKGVKQTYIVEILCIFVGCKQLDN